MDELPHRDSEKPWRQREAKFEDDPFDRASVMHRWESGWRHVFEALETPTPADDMDRIAHTRNQGHTVVEAIQRQLTHYAYHVGQLVYLGKWLKGDDWENLSIPRGPSAACHREKMQYGPPHGLLH